MPNTIAQNLARLIAARTDIVDAIIAKGGTVASGDGFEEFPADIATIPSGGGESAERNDVNFYDYDGTIVDSYSASDFASLTALPDNPNHEGLTAQGWNWGLADAKTYVAKYGKLDVGQMYITDDGKTRIYISLHDGRLSPVLGLGVNGSVDIDWGDNTEHTTLTGSSESTAVFTQPHNYAAEGEYVIIITPSNGSTFSFVGDVNIHSELLLKNSTISTGTENQVYQGAVTAIEIGDNVTVIGNYAFQYCRTLVSIIIPDSVTSIGNYAFEFCYSLASATIPDSVTSIGNYAFSNCFSLAPVTIPDSVPSIATHAFQNCYALASVIIPDSVTSISSYAFYYCRALVSVIIPDSVPSISTYAFANCSSLVSATISDSLTSIGTYAFQYCYALASVIIPDSLTSIANYAFNNCYALASVIIPDSLTSISSFAFQNCTGLGFVKFESTTPPTVSSANAFTGVPNDCIIYVPAGYLEDYEDATNYPDPDVYTYVEY